MQTNLIPQVARRVVAGFGSSWCGIAVAVALVLPTQTLVAQNKGAAATPPSPFRRVTQVGIGPTNSITDVPNLKVGMYTRTDSGYRTGTTVIRTEYGATAGYSQMGGAPGTKETDLLKPGGEVRTVQAIVLSGGSAYGLDAATGVMRWMEEHNYGVPIGTAGVVPIVPAAILMDLGRGGKLKKRPDADFGYKAAEAATNAPVKSGRVGVGMGAGWGMGTASVKLSNGYTVAAIVGVNPAGSPLDPHTCLPYGLFLEMDNEFNLVQPSASECKTAIAGRTDAPIEDLEAERMAEVADAGLARSIRPIFGISDGDTVFGMATSAPTHTLTNADLQGIFQAAADVLGRAIVHAVVDSHQVGSSRVGYCEEYPSACVKRHAQNTQVPNSSSVGGGAARQ
jgi:L-aminopeptidase/D-esterase-like protein